MSLVLVVDDNPLILRLCQMILAKAGYRLVLAPTVVQALRSLDENKGISAILIDAGLASPSSREFLQALERTPDLRNTPVILLESREASDQGLADQFPAVCRVLKKPFPPATLLQTLQAATRSGTISLIEAKRSILERSIKPQPAPLSPTAPVENPLAQMASTGAPPALMGQIEIMPVAEILQILSFQCQTGLFRAIHDEKEICIFFEKGRIQLATSQNLRPEFWLGRVLLQTRSTPAAPLESALVLAFDGEPSKRGPLGKRLVDEHVVDADHLRKALKEQTCALMFELLRWKQGRFSFEALRALPDLVSQARLEFAVDTLLLEGCRRIDEWKVLEQELGPLQTVLERTAQSRAVLDSLSEPEKSVLSHLDGAISLGDLADRMTLPSVEVYRVCKKLVARKVLQPRTSETAQPRFDA